MSSQRDKISPEQRDHDLERAVLSLKTTIPIDTIQTVANWWNQWYRFTGHRRLGRALREFANSRSPKKTSSQGPEESGAYSSLRARTITDDVNYIFSETELESPAMFAVKTIGGDVHIALNTSHPAYSYLKVVTRSSDLDPHEIRDVSAENANEWSNAIGMLLESWARYEEEQPNGNLRARAQNARLDWGRVAREQISNLSRESV